MKIKATLLILWACSIVVAFLVGKARQDNQAEASVAHEPEVPSTIEEAPVASPVEEPKRLPGPVKLSLLEMLYSKDFASYNYQFGRLLEGLDADTLPLFLEEFEALPSIHRKEQFFNKLMARWGELDPQAAVAYLDSFPGELRGQLLTSMAESWAKADPQAAWDYVMEESKNGRKYHINLHSLFQSAFEADPNLAVSLINQVDNEGRRNGLCSWLGTAVAETGNFQTALNVIRSMNPSGEKSSAMLGIWQSWAGTDPESARAFYDLMEPGPEKDDALKSMMYGWATKNPQEALNYYLDEVEGPNRGDVLKEVIRGWAATGRLMEAASYLLELPVSEETDEAVNGIIYQMSLEDPATAIGWADSLQNEGRKKQAISTALYHWVKEDPDSARDYVMEMPPGEERDGKISTLVFAQCQNGVIPETSIPLIESMEDQDSREKSVISLARAAISESSYFPSVTENNKLLIINQITSMEGISDETKSRAISLIRGDPPEE